MEKYVLKESVEMDFNNNELYLVDGETGFVANGNKHAFQVLEAFKAPNSTDDIIAKLTPLYSDAQHPRIKKSVPKIIAWALERNILKKSI